MIKTTCSECNSNIEFPNAKKQFRACPECLKCLSIDYFDEKISIRTWIAITALFLWPFYSHWYVLIIVSIALRFLLIANGTLLEYSTSVVSDKYCINSTNLDKKQIDSDS